MGTTPVQSETPTAVGTDLGLAASFIALLLQRDREIAFVDPAVILRVAMEMIYRGVREVLPVLNGSSSYCDALGRKPSKSRPWSMPLWTGPVDEPMLEAICGFAKSKLTCSNRCCSFRGVI